MKNPIVMIKEWKKKRETLATAKKYYETLRQGAKVIKFIYEDLKRQESGVNRHQRRRFEHEIAKEGKFSPEMIEHYAHKFDSLLAYIAIEEKTNSLSSKIKQALKQIGKPKTVMPLAQAVKEAQKAPEEKVAGYNPKPANEVRPEKPTPTPPAKNGN